MDLHIAEAWQATYPGAVMGIMTMEKVSNPEQHAGLEERKTAVETALREQFQGAAAAALDALPSIRPYAEYYGRFKKTYHVRMQLESVALKGKSLPRVAALVEAMFMAELQDQLLTAGHDLDALAGEVRLEIAGGDERYVMLNGKEQTLKAGDMALVDEQGIISCIIYGPDQRTRITPATRRALFVVYGPPGITAEMVRRHLENIRDYVQLVSPEAEVTALQVY
jgi:DNA/RNA-binding domain of Phe-tRNA-synthetase-like protein